MNPATTILLKNFLTGQAKLAAAAAAAWLVKNHLMDPSMTGTLTDLTIAAVLGGGAMLVSWWTSVGHTRAEVLLKKMTGTETVADAKVIAAVAPPAAMVSPNQVAVATEAAKVASVLILAVLLLSTLDGGSASAQQKLTGNLAKDIAASRAVSPLSPADPFGDLMAQIEKIKAETIDGLVAALNEADADAGTVVNAATGDVKDPISHACYPAQIKFLKSLPAYQPIQSPAPFNVIVLFQRKRDFVAQIKAGIPAYLKLGCVPLFGDEIATAVQTLAMVGVKIAPAAATAMFPALAPVSLPAMLLTP